MFQIFAGLCLSYWSCTQVQYLHAFRRCRGCKEEISVSRITVEGLKTKKKEKKKKQKYTPKLKTAIVGLFKGNQHVCVLCSFLPQTTKQSNSDRENRISFRFYICRSLLSMVYLLAVVIFSIILASSAEEAVYEYLFAAAMMALVRVC